MNMFERTHAFVPDHFIRHYTLNYNFLLINAKNAKIVPYMEKHIFDSDFIAYHDNAL